MHIDVTAAGQYQAVAAAAAASASRVNDAWRRASKAPIMRVAYLALSAAAAVPVCLPAFGRPPYLVSDGNIYIRIEILA